MEKHKGRILIVEDEKSMREVLKILLEGERYEVVSASDGLEGLAFLTNDIFDLVITDIKMPKVDGFELLKKTKEISPDTIVIMITAFGTTEAAIKAMKSGAYDYINKPFKIDEIRLIVEKALEKKRLNEEVSLLRKKVKTTYKLENIIGQSPQMQELFRLIPKVAQSNSNVLIIGESGSGKELVAAALHNLSNRKDRKLVAINCAAFPERLLESELFGHMRGSFTGALHNKQGLFEIADSGSLFLDEIGEMPINLQAKLLRVLENGSFRRVGGTTDIKVDVRVISATNNRPVPDRARNVMGSWFLGVAGVAATDDVRTTRRAMVPRARRWCPRGATAHAGTSGHARSRAGARARPRVTPCYPSAP